MKRGWRRCARCRLDWQPGRWPLRLSAAEWRRLLLWFVRDVPSAVIAREARLDRKRVLRALTVVRQRLLATPPAPVRQLRELEQVQTVSPPLHGPETLRGRPSRRSAVIGIYATDGLIWAEVAAPADAAATRAWYRESSEARPARLLKPYAAVAFRGKLRRVHAEDPAEHAAPAIGLIESFWAFAQRRLGARGGIRVTRLDLYLAECAWRFNRRRQSAPEQLRELVTLVHRAPRRWNERDFH